MKKDVLINIRGIQSADGASDTTELYTQGVFYRRGQNYYVVYEESETTGFEGCRTTLKVEGLDKVSMIRHGASRSNLVIERGARNVGFYNTVQGDLLIGISASDVDVKMNDDGGSLYFKYSLDINSTHISQNEVYVDVKENPNPLQA